MSDERYTLQEDDAAIIFNGDEIFLMIPQKPVYDPEEDHNCFMAMILAVALKEEDPQLIEVIERYNKKLADLTEEIDEEEIEFVLDEGDDDE